MRLEYIFCVALWSTSLTGCDKAPSVTNKEEAGARASERGESNRPIRVVVQSPRPSKGDQEFVLPGTIEAWERAPLFARVTGYLQSVDVDIGDEVEKGAKLAQIVVPEIVAQLASAKSKVAQSQAELELARLTQTRLEGLRKANPDAIPQQDVDVAKAKVHIAAAQVGVSDAERQRLQSLLNFGLLRAPFSGRITKRVLDSGALAREGTTSDALPIVEITRTDKLRLAFEVPEPMVRHVKKGTKVTIRLDARAEEGVLEASVARFSGALDPSTRSMRAEIDLKNSEGIYQPGTYASVQLHAKMNEGALTLPSRAVRGKGSDRYCLVVREGVLEKVPVVVASDDGKVSVIARGLSEEDLVMTAGSALAREGSLVETVKEEGS